MPSLNAVPRILAIVLRVEPIQKSDELKGIRSHPPRLPAKTEVKHIVGDLLNSMKLTTLVSGWDVRLEHRG